jgi:hypothetical protein
MSGFRSCDISWHADDITGLSSPSSSALYCMKMKLLLWRRDRRVPKFRTL